MTYSRFLAMIATSTVVMFGLMYLNTYLFEHVFWSETRAYMAVLMGATMAIVMLAFMASMYPSRAVNLAIFAGAAATFGLSLWLVRSQVTVSDTSFMRAMIPHHSIAIMTSTRSGISDPRVRKLADEIIYAQDKEIAEMRFLISSIESSGEQTAADKAVPASVVSLDEALSTAEVPILDPEFLSSEEVGQLSTDGDFCSFSYTADSKPVLAAGLEDGSGAGLVKISGDLVRLNVEDTATLATGPTLSAEGIVMSISAPGGGSLSASNTNAPQEADLILKLEAGLKAGYRGFYECRSARDAA